MRDDEIERAPEIQFLGVIIDSKSGLRPHISYVKENVRTLRHVWRYKTNPIYMSLKRAIRIVNHPTSQELTNPLLIKDLVDFKTAQIMYNVKNKVLICRE